MLSPTLFNLYSKYLTTELIRTVNYAGVVVLLVKEETVLQGMTDRLTETISCYEMEMNMAKTKVMRISRELTPLHNMTDQKQLENVEYFTYLCGVITNDTTCTREIKSKIDMAKAAFNKKQTLFTSNLESNLRKKLVKCYV